MAEGAEIRYNPSVPMKILPHALQGKKCLLFLDLEGTQFSHEMIEIGAYKVLMKDDFTVKKVFPPYHAYVLAKHHVGPFVTKLTGITDLKLRREGIPFRTVQQGLKKYLGKDYENCVPIAYGTEDAHIFLASAENNMDASLDDARAFTRRFFDYANFFGEYVRGTDGNILSLTRALTAMEVDFEGTAHTAQDDALNLYKLHEAFLKKPELIEKYYKFALARNNRIPKPVRKLVERLNNGEDVTAEEWSKMTLKDFL